MMSFDKAVMKRCEEYKRSSMSRYENPTIRRRFGLSDVATTKTRSENQFSSIGERLPPQFGTRVFNLGGSSANTNMFSDTSSTIDLADFESQISMSDSYWDDAEMMSRPPPSEYSVDSSFEAERMTMEAEDEVIAGSDMLRATEARTGEPIPMRQRMGFEQFDTSEPISQISYALDAPRNPANVYQDRPDMGRVPDSALSRYSPYEPVANRTRARIE